MEAYASNAAIGRLKQEDCFEFKVSLRCIVKFQANLDYRMRPCPLKRPRELVPRVIWEWRKLMSFPEGSVM